MQCVILAAGRGSRMGKLTEKLPKSLLEVAGKTLLEHKFDVLPSEIDEIVLVIGYLGDMIRNRFGDSYGGKKITYVDCPNPVGGTMYALACAKDILRGKCIATNGDDIHTKEDIAKCLSHEWALAVMPMEDVGNASKVEVDSDGTIVDIVEADTHGGGSGLAGVGLYVLDARIFNVAEAVVRGRTETGLPQTMLAASRELHIPISAVEISSALHITTPEDIVRATQMLVR